MCPVVIKINAPNAPGLCPLYAPTLVSGRGMEKKRGGREGEKERLGEASGRPLGGPEGRERKGESGSVTGSSKGRVSFRLSSIVLHMDYAQVKQPLLDSQLRMFSVL